MGTFKTKKMIYGASALIPEMAARIQQNFEMEGYVVSGNGMSSGAYDLSITKGGMFKAVIGMKTALKVTLIPQGNDVCFEAGVGIFGQQAIPTVISMLFFWPVLITQIWGMVEQAKLDDKALAIAEEVAATKNRYTASSTYSGGTAAMQFCIHCGHQTEASAKFCPNCGKALK